MTQTNLRPLKNRVVIERLTLPDRTASGLYLLGREYPALGSVLAIGSAVRVELQIGDLVYFNRSKPELRSIRGEPEHFVLDEVDLYCRIREQTQDDGSIVHNVKPLGNYVLVSR